MRDCWLYRHFDRDGTLLYVGITYTPNERARAHSGESPWWPQVMRSTVERVGRRDRAQFLEAEAIRDENPIHNVCRPLKPPKLTNQLVYSELLLPVIAAAPEPVLFGCFAPGKAKQVSSTLRQRHARVILTRWEDGEPRVAVMVWSERRAWVDVTPFHRGHSARAAKKIETRGFEVELRPLDDLGPLVFARKR